MENVYAIVITKIPGGQKPVMAHGYETIADLFELAFGGESINGYQFQVNGSNTDTDYVPRAGDSVSCAKMCKGN